MPTFFKMSDDKKTDDAPTVVFTQTPAEAPTRKTKKYVIIAVTIVLLVAFILAAILVGMYMFTQAQKEIIQYTMQLSEGSKQDVTSDPNENVVQYHVSTPSQDAWIVNDFNKDIQLMKIVSGGETNCYLTVLNRTNAMDPSMITGPDTAELEDTVSLMYNVFDTPITDTSFLSKTASAMCKGISVYWLYPYCSNGNGKNKYSNETNVEQPNRKRRDYYVDNSPYYCVNSVNYTSPNDSQTYAIPCVTGCCAKVCACGIKYSSYVSHGYMYCRWVIYSCPKIVAINPVFEDDSCVGPRGLTCSNATRSCGCP